MTHLTPGGVGTPSPALAQSTPHLDLRGLRDGIADRRQRLLDLETELVAACETEASRGRDATVRMDDRGTWDRATWQRYLATAARLEPQFGPPMRRLYQEIDQLTRLSALPVAA